MGGLGHIVDTQFVDIPRDWTHRVKARPALKGWRNRGWCFGVVGGVVVITTAHRHQCIGRFVCFGFLIGFVDPNTACGCGRSVYFITANACLSIRRRI
jgi:hypothetical protein